jgi:hypothetical protein
MYSRRGRAVCCSRSQLADRNDYQRYMLYESSYNIVEVLHGCIYNELILKVNFFD